MTELIFSKFAHLHHVPLNPADKLV